MPDTETPTEHVPGGFPVGTFNPRLVPCTFCGSGAGVSCPCAPSKPATGRSHSARVHEYWRMKEWLEMHATIFEVFP